jgi:hypothetical protein
VNRLLAGFTVVILVTGRAASAQAQWPSDNNEAYASYEAGDGYLEADLFPMDDGVWVATVTAEVAGIRVTHLSYVRMTSSGGMVCYEPVGGIHSDDRIWGCVPDLSPGRAQIPIQGRPWSILQGCLGNNPRWSAEARKGSVCREDDPEILVLVRQ